MKRLWKSVQSFIAWLGQSRAYILFGLLAGTGLISLILNAAIAQQPESLRAFNLIQSLLLVGFIVGAAITVIGRFHREDRRQIIYIIVPTLIAASLAALFPNLALLFLPVGAAWLIVAPMTMRNRMRKEYQTAIKAMRKRDYQTAIRTMTELIDREPINSDHRRFRAELYRLSNKVRRARSDYEKVIELEPESAVGYNGLAEVYLQDGEYSTALPFAQKALALEPNHWVAPYNLGMIEDRLGNWKDATIHLEQAIRVDIPDSRHRLLSYLWLARAAYQLGNKDSVAAQVEKMKREKSGLQEWETIFESEEAAVLKNVLEMDVILAEKIVNKNGDLALLGERGSSPLLATADDSE